MSMDYDVAIVGGGPAGSTCAALLKKYRPSLRVGVFERDVFPRDHVGESLLPVASQIIHEMGAWDKIEAANFPIKVGATYRWGRSPELWDFEFLPERAFVNQPRPAKYRGQRMMTAFQVDRGKYDQILLDHAASLGAEVFQGTKVAAVRCDGQRVEALELEDGRRVSARHYVDGSGNSGILRRALDVECEYPASLRNIAIYDYWQNADWAIRIGVGGTRIQVLTVGYGWIWFIPISPTRTSIGLVVPADYYKKSGLRPEELYARALREESIVADLIRNATPEGRLTTTRDWSFNASRHAGENWFLVGDSGGFADPILSAGVSITHIGARQAAYTILEIERGEQDPAWLRDQFERRQKQRIETHIRFSDFWYTSNAQFRELQEFTSTLANDIGLDLAPESAWRWIATGGFLNEDMSVGAGGFSLALIRDVGEFLGESAFDSPLEKFNLFTLNLEGAVEREIGVYEDGRVVKAHALFKGKRVLPLTGEVGVIFRLLRNEKRISGIIARLNAYIREQAHNPNLDKIVSNTVPTMEAMIHDGWIDASLDPAQPLAKIAKGHSLQWHRPQRTLSSAE